MQKSDYSKEALFIAREIESSRNKKWPGGTTQRKAHYQVLIRDAIQKAVSEATGKANSTGLRPEVRPKKFGRIRTMCQFEEFEVRANHIEKTRYYRVKTSYGFMYLLGMAADHASYLNGYLHWLGYRSIEWSLKEALEFIVLMRVPIPINYGFRLLTPRTTESRHGVHAETYIDLRVDRERMDALINGEEC
ncbi:MAG: hypothetical protein AB7L09_21485 [Nitrospira sp.]